MRSITPGAVVMFKDGVYRHKLISDLLAARSSDNRISVLPILYIIYQIAVQQRIGLDQKLVAGSFN